MTVLELASKCVNSGSGKIRVINNYNSDDTATFNSIIELEKIPYIANHEVLNWEFCPHKRLDAISWEFVLEVMI